MKIALNILVIIAATPTLAGCATDPRAHAVQHGSSAASHESPMVTVETAPAAVSEAPELVCRISDLQVETAASGEPAKSGAHNPRP